MSMNKKKITFKEYDALAQKIIDQGLSTEDTLMDLLTLAGKYEIVGENKNDGV